MTANVFAVAADEQEFRYGPVAFQIGSQRDIDLHRDQWRPWLSQYPRRRGYWNLKDDQLDTLESRAAEMKVRPGRVYVMDQKTKWGNCSRLRNLSFNWRLVKAPPAVLDYIVVHELAHLLEASHSVRFWLVVRSHCLEFEWSCLLAPGGPVGVCRGAIQSTVWPGVCPGVT